MRNLDILLVGETGKGKSTWINAFANYCMFPTLQDAIDNGGCFPIPMQFCLAEPDPTDPKIKANRLRVIGTHTDLYTGDPRDLAYSQTMESQKYSFRHKKHGTVTLIDTPGFLDVSKPESPEIDSASSSADRDRRHANNTMRLLASFKKIDAIFVFLKSSDNKLDDNFKTTLCEIFRRLHATAAHNVVFIVTFVAPEKFKSDKVSLLLKNFIRENKLQMSLPLAIFSFENDAVRYIVEEKNRIRHTEVAKDEQVLYWDQTVSQIQEVLRHVCSLRPHNLIDTLDIHNAKSVNEVLTDIVLKAVDCTFHNEIEIATTHKQLQQLDKDHDKKQPGEYDIGGLLQVKEEVVVVESLPHVNVVCESERCTQIVGGNAIPRRCCENCSAAFMFFCNKIDIFGKCRVCNCSKNRHRWTSLDIKLVRRNPEKVSAVRVNQIVEMKDKRIQLFEAITEMESRLRENRREKELMLRICAKLSIFQQMKAVMTPLAAGSQDPVLNGLKKMITAFISAAEEKPDSETETRLKELKRVVVEYENFLFEAKRESNTADNLETILTNLYDLPVQGEYLRQACRNANIAVQSRRESKRHPDRSCICLPENCALLEALQTDLIVTVC